MKRRTFILAALGVSVAGPALLWQKHKPAGALQVFSAADIAFGTTINLQVVHHDADLARSALHAAITAVKDVDALMSLYRADSQVSLLNRDSHLHQPDVRLRQVLQAAQELARQTNGAFDATVQPLWQAASQAGDMRAAQALVDWRKLTIESQRITLAQEGMAITLNGIAQGYGVDQALQALQRHGIQHALLDTGEFGAIGVREDGHPWMVALRDPRAQAHYAQVLAMDGRRMATSGDYETVFSQDYTRHHIFDPHTGASPTELASVTVLAPTGLLADGLSTAFMVMGADKSLALAATWEGVDLLCIAKNGKQSRSAGFPTAWRSV
jgi:thiamine biosynthesis lipoprotein